MSVSAGSGVGAILAYNAGVGGSNPSPPTTRTSRSTVVFDDLQHANVCSSGREIQQKSNVRTPFGARFELT